MEMAAVIGRSPMAKSSRLMFSGFLLDLYSLALLHGCVYTQGKYYQLADLYYPVLLWRL